MCQNHRQKLIRIYYCEIELHSRNEVTNICFFRTHSLTIGSNVISMSIKEAMRVIDSKEAEKKYAKKKLNYQADFIDIDSRATFIEKTATTSMIKCANAFNYYDVKSEIINRQL